MSGATGWSARRPLGSVRTASASPRASRRSSWAPAGEHRSRGWGWRDKTGAPRSNRRSTTGPGGGDLKGDRPTPGVPASPRHPPVQQRAEPRTVPSGASTPAGWDGDPPSIPAKNGGEGGVDRMKALFSELGQRTARPPDVPSVPVSVLPGTHSLRGVYPRPHPRPLSPRRSPQPGARGRSRRVDSGFPSTKQSRPGRTPPNRPSPKPCDQTG